MDSVYRTHPTPTGVFRDGELVPVDEAGTADIAVWFALPAEDGVPAWEALAARAVGPDQAVVRAVPLFAYGLNFGDRVTITTSDEGALVATGIAEDGRHHGFRVWPAKGSATLADVVREYGARGCYIEGFSEDLVGLSCSSDDVEEVAAQLLADEQAGRFRYETNR